MTGDNILAAHGTFVVSGNACVDFRIEIQTGQQSLCAIFAHTAINRLIGQVAIVDQVAQFLFEPFIKFCTGNLHRGCAVRRLRCKRSLTEDVAHPVVAHGAQRTHLIAQTHDFSVVIPLGIGEELVAHGYMGIQSGICAVDVTV